MAVDYYVCSFFFHFSPGDCFFQSENFSRENLASVRREKGWGGIVLAEELPFCKFLRCT